MAQLGGAAAFNLAAPLLLRGRSPILAARWSLAVAAAGYLLAITASPALFIAACLICGSALGVVLNVTNKLMGSAEHVQKGYAVFVLIEVFFATFLFLTGTVLIAHFGLLAVFPAVSVAALVAIGVFPGLAGQPEASAPVAAARPAPHRRRGLLGLAAFGLFFIGQATLNSFMPQIGQATALSAEHANQVIGLGMPFGFLGAMLARLVGERVKPIAPISLVVVVLALVAPLLTGSPSLPIFIASVIALAISTIFSVPYFFAQLGAVDRSGRYASFGPAMMLTGLAIGPSAAVLLNASFGLAAVGLFSSALLLSGGVCFALSALPARRGGTGVDYPKQTIH
jgi:predicted MFS family arabinose efflux permease